MNTNMLLVTTRIKNKKFSAKPHVATPIRLITTFSLPHSLHWPVELTLPIPTLAGVPSPFLVTAARHSFDAWSA